MSIIINKDDIGKDSINIDGYMNCFPGYDESTIRHYFSNNKKSEKWIEFNESGEKYGFCAYEKTSIKDILNEYSRYEYKDNILNELNRIYRKKSTNNINKCISDLKVPVYWIHSLCVFKNSRKNGKCLLYIIPEIIKAIKNIHKNEQIILLADVVHTNQASFNCFTKNNFVATEFINSSLQNSGLYYNKGLEEYCYMLMLVINKNKMIGGKRLKTQKKKKKIIQKKLKLKVK